MSKWKENQFEIKTSIKDTISTVTVHTYECVFCGYTVNSLNDISNFCPNCGSKMDNEVTR